MKKENKTDIDIDIQIYRLSDHIKDMDAVLAILY